MQDPNQFKENKEEIRSEVADVRKQFLILFMREVIEQTELDKKKKLPFDKDKILKKLLESNDEEEEPAKKKELIAKKEKAEIKIPIVNMQKNLQAKPRFPVIRQISQKIPAKIPQRAFPARTNFPTNVRPPNFQVRPSLAVPEKIIVFSMNKINGLFLDPLVQMLECLGPDKQILVYKSGVIQNTNITLSNEEINALMKEISEKTKIPLISGVFKTALGNLIITAVISDFIGTRFIIQKKSPAQ